MLPAEEIRQKICLAPQPNLRGDFAKAIRGYSAESAAKRQKNRFVPMRRRDPDAPA